MGFISVNSIVLFSVKVFRSAVVLVQLCKQRATHYGDASAKTAAVDLLINHNNK